ncbi:dephospho-CoA kinase [Arthrobacter sp. B2a2-09]|uniref:dephospho-CoA kinase n=1 Tax=Arthrobacter sp. B2a2-09 TaxID=2952822 RepID=UPI0022CD89D8|nr:dephospho-CoA kinase [Arthrobacter sp. B2a2-09]MCZ9883584.1 dephospho-CoA kinase [Arthrobacter sp. B2a2-09]
MLKIGLTGGIASGKSLVSARLTELGAVLIDADALAREVVEPGTPGLARVVAEFGEDIVDADGRLDRARLGAIVFAEPDRREALNAIIHPRVREKAAAMLVTARPGDIVVQDIPLLVEAGQGSSFHLVLVVDAPDEERIRRMTEIRGMTVEDAVSRMAAQAGRDERLAAADIVLDNSGSVEDVTALVDTLWEDRFQPFARNLAAGRPAPRAGGPVLSAPNPNWPVQAERLLARIRRASPEVLGADHIGSTSVQGLRAKDIIDLQVNVSSLEAADRIAEALGEAGFPLREASARDTPKPPDLDPSAWQKRFHCNADPGRAANVHVRVLGSPGWRYALLFRDWLRANPDAVRMYADMKQALAALHAGDPRTLAYAEAKEPWFTEVAWPLMDAWAGSSGWQPPSYSVAQG